MTDQKPEGCLRAEPRPAAPLAAALTRAEIERLAAPALARRDPEGLHRLGVDLRERGQIAEALQILDAARRLPLAALEVTLEAARTAFALGHVEDALHRMRQALHVHPGRHEVYFWLGAILAQIGRHGEAAEQFRAALAIEATSIDSLKGLVLALVELRNFHEAEAPALVIRQLVPSDALACALLSCIYAETNRPDEAIAAAEEALRLEPDDVAALLQLAQGLALLERNEDAIAVLSRAKRLEPDLTVVSLRLATALKVAGHLDRAHEQFLDVLEQDPDQISAYCDLAEIHDFKPGDALIAAMEALRTKITVPSEAARLDFALGKAYDDILEPVNAFAYFKSANEAERLAFPYNETLTLARVDRMTEIFSSAFMGRLGGAGTPSDQPIFIVGIPRSGTTLVEQILASHREVHAAGEIDFLSPAVRDVLARAAPASAFPNLGTLTKTTATQTGEEYLRRLAGISNGKRRVTDKQLSNRRLIGLIHLALPNAKIIHCMRNPLDTCLSCYMKPFGARVPYASDLAALGRYYRRYHMMMAHWRRVLPHHTMLEVRYEDVVAGIETEARRIIEYCGLEWDEHCLSFHQTRRPVHTVSAAQVRKPIYRTSVGRWEAYASFLAPLITELGDLAQTVPF